MQRRAKEDLARFVTKGIAIDAGLGAVRAWAFMARRGVPVHVIRRVLCEHGACRPEDRAARQGGRTDPCGAAQA